LSHLAALRDALAHERAAVEAEHARLAALPLPARAAAGFSVYPLSIEATELRSKGRVNVVLRGRVPADLLAVGDPVLLAPLGRPDEGHAARVEGLDEHTLELRVDDPPQGAGPWVLSRRLDFHVHGLQVAALERAERLNTPLANLLLGYEKPYRADPYEHAAFAMLDPSQRAAAELALGATEVGLLHGPPGTGKTATLVAILRALREMGERPWALADSNAAVDHLALQAHAAGLDVVRLGASARIESAVQHLTLEWRILNGPRSAVIRELRRQAARTTGPEGIELRDAIRAEWAAAKRELLASADVVAMTLGTLHTRGMELVAPRTAVVDEAAQVSEPALWLLAARVKRFILAGDPMQLGPVLKSRDQRLERSLLQRLVESGFLFPMLTTQYRFNAELQALSAVTYGGKLNAHPSVAEPVTSPAAQWIDTAGMGLDEERDALDSLYNVGELRLLKRAWDELLAQGVRPEQVGIVTPYRAQLSRLRELLPGVEAGTVNAFQGREKDVILASFVRSNPEQELGFVADPRRLNVAVTRARQRFVGIGDVATLGASPHFQRLVDEIAALGGYRSGWEFES